MRYSDFVIPYWARQVRRHLLGAPVVLDFGCGNDVHMTRRWLPGCLYHGADLVRPGTAEAMHEFYLVSANDDLSMIPDRSFDVVLMKHVIEHLQEPIATLRRVLQKLKPNGIVYLSFPSPKSIHFPSATGTLNFYDDPAHVWVPSIEDILSELGAGEIVSVQHGTTRSYDKVAIGILLAPWNWLRILAGRKRSARWMWDLYGFEYHILGIKRT